MDDSKAIFLKDATVNAADGDQRAFIRKALGGYYTNRDLQKARYRDWERARDAASMAKWSAVNDLANVLEKFVGNFERNGGVVHWARDAAEARAIILKIAEDNQAKAIVKSKCMTSEEIHLNDALEKAGYGVVESDLGEFIQQLRGEAPYHFVFPCMHVKREAISELFTKHLGTAPTDSPEELTMIARRHLRQLYVDADIGITGANFLIAETGQISITENEGNARLTAALPRIHIALSGIEKVVNHLDDLSVLLPMLATAGAGQPMTCYNTLYSGPRKKGECDGPEQFHLVLLDNARTRILADPEQRDALHCIRCGACTDACPVRIDLHHHLLHNLRNATKESPTLFDQVFHHGFNFVIKRPWLFATGGRIFRATLPLLQKLPIPYMGAWMKTRDLPKAPAQSFRDQWKNQNV